jgi:hypothetical protein
MTPFNHAKGFSRAVFSALLTVSIVFFCLVASSSAAEPHAIDASVVSLARPSPKAQVQALGLGATVKISTLSRRQHYRGYITKIDEDSFEVTDRATLSPNALQYWTVYEITGQRLSDPTKHTRKQGVPALFNAVSSFGFGP